MFILGVSLHLCWYFSPEKMSSKQHADESPNPIHNQTRSLTAISKSTQPQCVRAKEGDTQPWVHNAEMLSSFPTDNPLPRFLGEFRDETRTYGLELYQDEAGIFGELSTPLLDADSPTSRLYDVFFDPETKTLRFRAEFGDEQLEFTGALRSRMINGTIVRGSQRETVALKRLRQYDEYPFVSRAQFECAMLLFNRN